MGGSFQGEDYRADHRRVTGQGPTTHSTRGVRRFSLPVRRLGAGGLGVLAALALLATPSAPAKMTSVKLTAKHCETTGGGRFVQIKQFPGERIDRRLRRDVKFLLRNYKIFITDAYSLDPVHSANGEHPIGLAMDIVPNFSRGGSWNDIDRLARWAEPSQNRPRAPFRWVGYNGDSGHGRGHHLHLSYAHSPTSYNRPARTAYSIKCPKAGMSTAGGDGSAPKPDGGSKDGSSSTVTSGGISNRHSSDGGRVARKHPESGGVSSR